jgi:4-diphosphocytidyl-2-C-methyl-D-erythritol kinase
MKPLARITARAHAKVNLDLRVLGVRADGYHELRTVFQSLALHDRLTCVAKPGPFTVKCRTPGVPLDPTNLVWKAASALWTTLGRGGDVCDTVIQIDKQIPLEAGLGGGSADAAAALMALARLWGGAPLTLLREIGAKIGADVPFFLSGGTALGLGRGEEIYPLVDLPPHFVVIVRPPFGVSTSEAYGGRAPSRIGRRFLQERRPSVAPAGLPVSDRSDTLTLLQTARGAPSMDVVIW